MLDILWRLQMSLDNLKELSADGKKWILANVLLIWSNNLVFAFDCFHQAACKDDTENLNGTIHVWKLPELSFWEIFFYKTQWVEYTREPRSFSVYFRAPNKRANLILGVGVENNGGGGGRKHWKSDIREGFLLTGKLENINFSTFCQCNLWRYLLKKTHSIVLFNNRKRTKCDKEIGKRNTGLAFDLKIKDHGLLFPARKLWKTFVICELKNPAISSCAKFWNHQSFLVLRNLCKTLWGI